MGHGQSGASVEKDLDYLKVVLVGSQCERGDVYRERGNGTINRLPALKNTIFYLMSLLKYTYIFFLK
jgi:hypothetical protein